MQTYKDQILIGANNIKNYKLETTMSLQLEKRQKQLENYNVPLEDFLCYYLGTLGNSHQLVIGLCMPHLLLMNSQSMAIIFTDYLTLQQVLCQGGNDSEVNRFRELLGNVHDGIAAEEDWQLLLTRDPSQVNNYSDFDDAIRLFYDKQTVADFNMEKLQSLGVPIARINAIHSNSTAASTKADDAGGLYPVIFLSVGASVMLTSNLWPEVGLCNGT